MDPATLQRNHKVRGSHYPRTKAFFPLHILQADFLTLYHIQRRYNSSYKYILPAISGFSHYAYAVPLRSKRRNKAVKALSLSIFKRDSYRKSQTNRNNKFMNPHVKRVLLKCNTVL